MEMKDSETKAMFLKSTSYYNSFAVCKLFYF